MRFKTSLLILCSMLVLLTVIVGCSSNKEKNAAQSGNKGQAQYTLKATFTAAAGSFADQQMQVFKEYVEKESNGRLKVDIYPGGTLVGADREQIEALQAGDVDVISPSSAGYVAFEPAAAIFDLPFLFPDIDTVHEVLYNKPTIKELEKKLAGKGIVPIGYELGGFRHLSTNNKVIQAPQDLKGLKVRVLENKNHIKLWELLGANPTPMSFSEVYTALEQGAIDAQENPFTVFADGKLYEVQNTMNLTGHIFNIGITSFSKKTLDKLPEDLVKIIKDGGKAKSAFDFEKVKEKSEANLKIIKDAKVNVVELSPDKINLFKEAVKPLYDDIANQTGKDLVEGFLKDVESSKK